MSLIVFTNPSAEATVNIDSDRGDRVNTYSLFTVAPSSSKGVDEADIIPPFDTAIPNALKGGTLTTVENDLDNIVDAKTKNFVSKGLGIHYMESVGILKGNRAVFQTEATGKMGYVSANGGTVSGILRSDTTNGQYMRVAVDEGTTVTVELGGSVASGDYLMSDTTGRAITATSGKKAFGKAPSAGAVNDTKSFTLSFTTRP